jgi:hypothetical protein
MANITVKNKANADVVYVSATPSSGDRTPAVWTQNAASPYLDRRPKLSVSTRNSGGQLPARIIQISTVFPVVETIQGADVVTARVVFNGSVTLPTNCDGLKASDGFHQLGGLIASALMREVGDTGFAPS